MRRSILSNRVISKPLVPPGGFAGKAAWLLLGAVALVALIYAVAPLQVDVDSTSTEGVLCAKSTRKGVVLADCSERGWLAGWVDTDRFLGAQTKFRDPIY